MPLTNPVVRSLHDLGLAAWFGGSLMANVGLHGGAEQSTTRRSALGW